MSAQDNLSPQQFIVTPPDEEEHVKRALSVVPSNDLEGLKEINTGFRPDKTGAWYSPSEGKITMNRSFNGPGRDEEKTRTLVHEIGHHVRHMSVGYGDYLAESEPIAEAHAENYADEKLPGVPSHYDAILKRRGGRDSLGWGQAVVGQYRKARVNRQSR